jgi:hypothetical protein
MSFQISLNGALLEFGIEDLPSKASLMGSENSLIFAFNFCTKAKSYLNFISMSKLPRWMDMGGVYDPV